MPPLHRDVIWKGFWLGWAQFRCSHFLRAVLADTVALSLRPDLWSLQKNPGEVSVIEEISNEELQTFFKEFSYKWQVLEN